MHQSVRKKDQNLGVNKIKSVTCEGKGVLCFQDILQWQNYSSTKS